MTIKPVINQNSNENREKDHSQNQVDQQVANNGNNHRNINNSVENYAQSPQHRSDVFDDISRHRRSPHRSNGSRQKRNNDHLHHAGKRLNENREKLNPNQNTTSQYLNQVISAAQHHGERISPHHSHAAVLNVNNSVATAINNKSPKHNSNSINSSSLLNNANANTNNSISNTNLNSSISGNNINNSNCNQISLNSSNMHAIQKSSVCGSSLSPKCTQGLPRTTNTIAKKNVVGSGNCSNMNNNSDNVLVKQLEDTLNGYNSGDEWLVPKDGAISNDDWSKRDEQFSKAMKNRGFIIKNVEEDGACLFRAISLQLYGDQEMHDLIRQQTMDYIYQNSEYFAHFVTEDINDYVKRKRNTDSHGNHIEIQAMSELYNRPVELYCYQTTPINIFNSEQISNGQYPLRLSYQRGSHYNAIVDPYNASVGVGLGLAGYKPESQTREAMKLSEQLEIEQTMFEDKLKTTDWEATNEALQEQVARESYLQWCRENIVKSRTNKTDVRNNKPYNSSTITENNSNKYMAIATVPISSTSKTVTLNSTITSGEAHNNHHHMKNHYKNQQTSSVAADPSITYTESCYITTINTTTAVNMKNNLIVDSQTLDKLSNNHGVNINNDHNNDGMSSKIDHKNIKLDVMTAAENMTGFDMIGAASAGKERNQSNSKVDGKITSTTTNSYQSYNNMLNQMLRLTGNGIISPSEVSNVNKYSFLTEKNLGKIANLNSDASSMEYYCDSDDTDMSSTSSVVDPPSSSTSQSSTDIFRLQSTRQPRKCKRTTRLKKKFKEMDRGNIWSNQQQRYQSMSSKVYHSKKSKIEETPQQFSAKLLAGSTKNTCLVDYFDSNRNVDSSNSSDVQLSHIGNMQKEPSTSRQMKEQKSLSSFYQSLLESSYTDDGIGQLTENEMIQKAIQMSRIDYFEDQKLKFGYFQVQHQDQDDDST